MSEGCKTKGDVPSCEMFKSKTTLNELINAAWTSKIIGDDDCKIAKNLLALYPDNFYIESWSHFDGYTGVKYGVAFRV